VAVYFIAEISIIDRDLYARYVEQVRPIVERFGGRYLARSGKVTPVSGGWTPERIILIEFPSERELAQCFDSQEYRAIAPLREQSTRSRAIVVEGREEQNARQRVLFLCTGNSARSQMAEGLLRHEAGDRFEVFSAGTHPTTVRFEAVAVMSEIGIDISGHHSKSIDEFVGKNLDFVITVCDNAKESCPVFPGSTKRMHWSFEDPAAVQGTSNERKAAFRRIRDQIHARIREFTGARTVS
jgi:arsenate reductase (thioredoxin)